MARAGLGRTTWGPHETESLPALLRFASFSKDIGCRALLIHAESNDARDFYRPLVAELEDSPTDPLHLILLMKDIRRTLTR